MSDEVIDGMRFGAEPAHQGAMALLDESKALYLQGALHVLGILDASPEAVFDDLASLALDSSSAQGIEITFADGRRLATKASAGQVPSAALDAAVTETDEWPITLGSGLAVGTLIAHGHPPVDDKERRVLERIARLCGSVLDERLAANWHAGGAHAIGVTVVDSLGILLSASPDLEHVFGWRVEEVLGRSMIDLIHPDEFDEAMIAFERTARTKGLKAPFDVRIRRKDGTYAAVELTADNRTDDENIGGIVYTVRSQHNRPRGEDMLVREASVLQLIARGEPMDVVAAGIAAVLDELIEDGQGCVMLVDEGKNTISPVGSVTLPWGFRVALESMPIGSGSATCGVCVHQGQSSICADVTTDPSWNPYREQLDEYGVMACWSLPVIDARQHAVLGTVAVFRTQRGRPTIAESQIMDLCAKLTVTAIDRVAASTELWSRATHDSLTGLANRDLFLTQLEESLESANGQGPAVVIMDLDRFTVVNDSLGHDAGDHILKTVAARLGEALRPPSLVARLGGDEFTCLVPIADRAQAMKRAQQLLSVFDDPIDVGDREVFLNGCVGVSVADSSATLPTELLQQADAALFRAKELGPGQSAIFDEEMRAKAHDRMEVEHGLRSAIRQDELVVHFQPQFTMDRTSVVGVEALVRWKHPQWGMVGPGRFIAIAEETGVIGPVTDVVLDAACEMAEAIRAVMDDHVIPVWVNLSASQISHSGLVDSLVAQLAESGIDPPQIGFEITESAVMRDTEAGVRNLHRLRDLGFPLGIDDFGTGYSSLSYLRRLPVNLLKLDQSFVVNLGKDAQHDAIVHTVFDLAHTLDMVALAEGVETAAQLAKLAELGCDLVQGFLFARPGPPQDILNVIASLGES